MSEATVARHKTPLMIVSLAALLIGIAVPVGILGQGGRGGGQRGGAPVAPGGRGGAQGGGAGARAAAPVDLTGYWVSIVTEDWIERMAPDSPPSGVVRGGGGGGGGGGRGGGGRGGGGATTNDPCRVYAAGGSMRVPGRIHVTWADDNTLKIDLDSGTQTRLLHFSAGDPPPGPRTLQGYSEATWEGAGGGGRGGRGGGPGGGGAGGARWGSLNVTTTNMSGGYLLSSRSTYSENSVLTEYFTQHSDFGVDYLTVTAQIQDGGQTRVTSSTFKKEADGSKFRPTGCDIVK